MRLPLCLGLLAIALGGCADGERPAAAGAARAPGSALAPPAPEAPANGPVRVRTVVLFSSGVGYFEHGGVVDGAASTTLRVTAGQLDDLLKSLLLEDRDGGRIGTVEYPSLDPIEKTLKSFQVDLSGAPSLAQLLAQLRGAKVSVSWNDQRLSGTVLGVEARTIALGETQRTTQQWLLDLLVGNAVRQVPIDESHDLVFDDAEVRDELPKALAALAQARDQDKKPVVLHFDGQGQRRVRVGYVVETPIWKTSYRLVMPARSGDPAQLQGWAIVENQTDEDWTDVRLSLVSGRPISFIQTLSQPLYAPRPVVEPELFASLRPQSYDGGMHLFGAAMEDDAKSGAGKKLKSAGRLRGGRDKADSNEMKEETEQLQSQLEAEEKPIDVTRSIQSAAAADRMGELFQYSVASVTLPRQRSAMLPIVTDAISVERVSIYNADALANHPLNGALVTNTTGKALNQGPMTVLDGGGYAGDARLDDLPPNDHRLVSYAVDIPVKVDATSQHDERTVVTAKIVDGVLVLTVKAVATRTYQFDNAAAEDRTIVLEHAFRDGWKLGDGPEPFEKTPSLYRWKIPVAAGKSAARTVREENVESESLAITDIEFGTLEGYATNGAIPPKVKEALAKAVQLRREQVELQTRIAARQQELQAIAQDQNRLRENMKTVEQRSDYYQRLLKKLNDQETQVEAKQKDLDALREQADAKAQELRDYIAGLKVD